MDAGKGREHDSRDGEGTIPWKESIEPSQERRPRDAEALPDNLLFGDTTT